MKLMFRLFTGLCALLLFLLPACLLDNEEARQQLLGRWELEQAFRNGRPTESLDQLYFVFHPDGNLETNLTGQPEVGSYEFDGDEIQQRETSISADFQVESLSDSTLVLRTQLRNYGFRFNLRKVADLSTEQSSLE